MSIANSLHCGLQTSTSDSICLSGIRSSKSKNPGLYGVPFILNKTANETMESWKPNLSTLTVVHPKGFPKDLTVTVVNAITEVINQIPGRASLSIARDWSTRADTSEESTQYIPGKIGLGQRCQNSIHIITTADINRTAVFSTLFRYSKAHSSNYYSSPNTSR